MTLPELLDPPPGVTPDPDEFVRAAMRWHFSPRTGSEFWLRKRPDLGFDPLTEIGTLDDLRRFPDVTAELRDVPAAALVPRGALEAGDRVVGVYESGGTTGAPKRVVLLESWLHRLLDWTEGNLDAHGFPSGADWLGLVPTGPHLVGELFRRSAARFGRLGFCVDLDPRWVKSSLAAGRVDDVDRYSEHLVDQAADVLATQQIGVLTITPPLLDRLVRRPALVERLERAGTAVRWGGTQMDADTRAVYRDDILPGSPFCGNYGSTMILGYSVERPGGAPDEPCVFDALAPFVTLGVVDPDTREPVAPGERGQVLMHHVSATFLLPNNLERDLAVRVPGPVGDSVADVRPVAVFEDEPVIEGVY